MRRVGDGDEAYDYEVAGAQVVVLFILVAGALIGLASLLGIAVP